MSKQPASDRKPSTLQREKEVEAATSTFDDGITGLR